MTIPEYDAVHALAERLRRQYGIAEQRWLTGRYPSEVRARREWIRLVQDSWGLTISETARLLGVDRCVVRGARV